MTTNPADLLRRIFKSVSFQILAFSTLGHHSAMNNTNRYQAGSTLAAILHFAATNDSVYHLVRTFVSGNGRLA